MRRIKTYTLKGLGGGSLGSGTVTSVDMTVPTGLTVTGNPITTSGTLALTMTAGYSIPQTASITNWDASFNNMIVSAAVTGTTTKTLTLTQQDAGTITANWTDSGVLTNIYTADGTLTGNRILTSGGFNLTFNGSNTASSAIARGILMNQTLIAAANSDVLIGLDVNPTFTLGAFTGTASIGLRVTSGALHLGGSITGRLTYEQFHVKTPDATLALQATSATSYSGVNMFDSSAALGASFQYGNASAAQFANTFFFGPRNATGKLQIVRGTTGTISLTMFSTGNFLIQNAGTHSDAGYRFDVNGTVRFQDNLLVIKNQAAETSITVSNTTAGTTSRATFISTSVNGSMLMGKVSSTYTAVGTIIQVNDAVITNTTNGDISIYNNVGTGRIKFASNASTTPQMVLSETGNLLVGTTTNVASAVLQAASTTQGFLPPRMTTTQKNAISSPATGLIVYDITLNKLCVYTTAWETITSI